MWQGDGYPAIRVSRYQGVVRSEVCRYNSRDLTKGFLLNPHLGSLNSAVRCRGAASMGC